MQPTGNHKPTSLQIAGHTLTWTKISVLVAILGLLTAGLIAWYDHLNPAPRSISQTATSANGNATNSVTSNAPSGSATQQPAVQQSATAQKQGNATNTVANGQGNATGASSSVATYSGNQTIVYAASGSTINTAYGSVVRLGSHLPIQIPAHSKPGTLVSVGGKKFQVSVIKQFNEIQKALQAQDYQRALPQANLFLEDNPDFAPGYNEYAIQLFVQGKYALAEDEWKRAIALDPANILYYNNLSQSRSRGSISVTPKIPQVKGPGILPDGTPDPLFDQGSFVVLNEGSTPVYDVNVQDFAVAPPPQKPAASNAQSLDAKQMSYDGFPAVAVHNKRSISIWDESQIFAEILPSQAVYSGSLYGTNFPLDPQVLSVMEIQVIYAKRSHGKAEVVSFKFFVGKNSAGQLAWFPKL